MSHLRENYNDSGLIRRPIFTIMDGNQIAKECSGVMGPSHTFTNTYKYSFGPLNYHTHTHIQRRHTLAVGSSLGGSSSPSPLTDRATRHRIKSDNLAMLYIYILELEWTCRRCGNTSGYGRVSGDKTSHKRQCRKGEVDCTDLCYCKEDTTRTTC